MAEPRRCLTVAWLTWLLGAASLAACAAQDWGSPPAGPPASPAPPMPAANASAPNWAPPPGDAAKDRPRLFLSADVLTALRERARGNAPSWVALRARCDDYADAQVAYPDGADYPSKGNIGEGYQGQGYFGPLLELSLCHQITRTLDANRATVYARKALEILDKMSEKDGPHAVPMERDSVYGIRFYGAGMAIAHDWLHAVMSPEQRRRVDDAVQRWIDVYEKRGFGRDHPQGNYFAGYYVTKALSALGSESGEDNARWRDFFERVHQKTVAPFYAAHLAGGGWPEGWGYGTLASLNMSLPAWAARTAKDVDLVGAGFSYPVDQAKYLLHFSWPNRRTLDDRGTIHASDTPSAFDPALAYGAWGFASMWKDPIAPAFHRFAREVKEAAGGSPTFLEPLVGMLLWDEQGADASFDDQPRAYLAKGMQTVAMRSSWRKDAVWASFSAGPYVNNPDSGEMLFDQGSLSVVRGDRPLLAYAPTRLVKGAKDGARVENQVYAALFGDKAERALFNVFYAKTPDGPKPGQIANVSAKTSVGVFEDREPFVVVRGDRLEETYRPGTVAAWTRQIAFFRPSLFVIDDRTEAANARADQWLAFHLSQRPHVTHHARVDAGDADDYGGALIPLLPRGAKTTTTDVFGVHKVWRAEIRGPKARTQRWCTVFDASASPQDVAAASLLHFTEGKARGTLLRRKDTAYVYVAAPDDANRIEGAFTYAVPTAALHVIADVPPNASYALVAQGRTVRAVPGGENGTKLQASAQGILAFRVSEDGKIEPVP
ncbi:hypothetical protein LZC95_38395 [Pendulispora brunnea]|uniref:DUF4962 domain-containing protein n=1 Tax=Pendulispora brunnea TaxID=2905690 RepID=A0ABZ2K2K4_9BACT